MPFNWIDAVIIVLLGYQIYIGWRSGSLSLFANFASFLCSLWLAIRFQGVVGAFLGSKFGLSAAWVNVAGYAAVAIFSQILLEEIFLYGVNKLPQKFQASWANRWLGAVLSGINTAILLAFFVLLVLALPLRGTLKQDVRNSKLSALLVKASELYGGSMGSSVLDIANRASKFFTVEPNSKQRITLDVPAKGMSYSVDTATEQQMIALVNTERTKRGFSLLAVDREMTEVAREKSRDMFERKYFSHYDPDGKNAADRMDKAHISYGIVGENLAFAPDLTSAHDGLMNSEGHRKNILDPRFHRIGIGVIDSGVYGKMFTQIFAD